MVPQHTGTPDESRRLSPEVEAQLEAALRLVAGPAHALDVLHDAVRAAAADARARNLRAEELLVNFKEVEARLGAPLVDNASLGDAERSRVIRALIEAYYAVGKTK